MRVPVLARRRPRRTRLQLHLRIKIGVRRRGGMILHRVACPILAGSEEVTVDWAMGLIDFPAFANFCAQPCCKLYEQYYCGEGEAALI